ncbi:hypothetical protein lerEdw1_011146, partial [Lerista edwardsae]
IKKYKKDYVRDAAFLCTLLPSNTPPAVSRVAALLVAYLTHRKPSFMSWDDMLSLCAWLHELLEDEDAELRTAARLSAEAVNRAYLDYEKRSCLCRCLRRRKYPHGFTP